MKGAVSGALICFYSAFIIPLSIAFSFEYQDLGVIDKTVGDCRGDGCAVEYPAPAGERSIRRYDGRFPFMSLADNLEKEV